MSLHHSSRNAHGSSGVVMHNCPTHGLYPCRNPEHGHCGGVPIPVEGYPELRREHFGSETEWQIYRSFFKGMSSSGHRSSHLGSHHGSQRASQLQPLQGHRQHGSIAVPNRGSFRPPAYGASARHGSLPPSSSYGASRHGGLAPPPSHGSSSRHLGEHRQSQGHQSYIPSSLQGHGGPRGPPGASSRGHGHHHGLAHWVTLIGADVDLTHAEI